MDCLSLDKVLSVFAQAKDKDGKYVGMPKGMMEWLDGVDTDALDKEFRGGE